MAIRSSGIKWFNEIDLMEALSDIETKVVKSILHDGFDYEDYEEKDQLGYINDCLYEAVFPWIRWSYRMDSVGSGDFDYDAKEGYYPKTPLSNRAQKFLHDIEKFFNPGKLLQQIENSL